MATVTPAKVTFPAEIFDAPTNVPLIHQVVVAQLAAARQGTHKVKTRGEVSGSGTKPFKQKGTGRARQGSIRMPQHTGGGIVHGPVPRDYSQRTPKKMVAAALRGTLSDRARAGRVVVLDAIVGDKPSTKQARTALESVVQGKRVLVITEATEESTILSVRNLPNVHVIEHGQLNAYDVVVSDDIVFTKAAFDAFVAARTAKEDSK
ncbi:50S ribosomal protein L4 [Leucobacter sp. UCMA 4100]|uniref:50S ribosomal protein L4 n=1 Tax=Leucobacter sp. UCMA 4100 TaxID=2810534 RepID=UPI0022EADB0A|nr:50S ribosomal protein L4 [Leucobacter sp. UCMA 4100]MDA3146223.1 50S ribosomal protein L4 [Leucobacter sp. UCMA 4100]